MACQNLPAGSDTNNVQHKRGCETGLGARHASHSFLPGEWSERGRPDQESALIRLRFQGRISRLNPYSKVVLRIVLNDWSYWMKASRI